MMNLIDSHDTVRYLEAADGDINALKMAASFQMTYVGAPHIWYGDEIAMMGKHDPDCRRPFNWKYTSDSNAVDLLDYYQKLIKIRKENAPLRRGSFKTLLAEGLVYAFEREYKGSKVVVVINNDGRQNDLNITIESNMRSLIDQISGKNYQINNGVLNIDAAPYTAYILK
jgi:glycosidase